MGTILVSWQTGRDLLILKPSLGGDGN